jgi:hypothetical protein
VPFAEIVSLNFSEIVHIITLSTGVYSCQKGGPLSEQLPTSGSSEGPYRPDQTVMPGASGPVPGRSDFTPGPELTSNPSEPLIERNRAPDPTPDLPRLQQPRRGRRLGKKPEEPVSPLTVEQRLLVLRLAGGRLAGQDLPARGHVPTSWLPTGGTLTKPRPR